MPASPWNCHLLGEVWRNTSLEAWGTTCLPLSYVSFSTAIKQVCIHSLPLHLSVTAQPGLKGSLALLWHGTLPAKPQESPSPGSRARLSCLWGHSAALEALATFDLAPKNPFCPVFHCYSAENSVSPTNHFSCQTSSRLHKFSFH